MKQEDFQFFTVEEITTPREGYIVIANKYWATTIDGKVATYKKYYPQCRHNKELAKSISMSAKIFSGEVVFVPAAFIPRSMEE